MIDRSPARLRDAIEALFFGYRAFTDLPDRVLERQGLGRVHHRILYFVGRHPGVSVKGLLEILSVSKQAINAPLRRLVDLGLVAMSADGADRRLKNLRLTAEGERLEAELTGAQMRHLSRAFEAAGPDGQAGWTRVMDALAGRRA
jgi:DNA-binding MarR family transcriptional regulator